MFERELSFCCRGNGDSTTSTNGAHAGGGGASRRAVYIASNRKPSQTPCPYANSSIDSKHMSARSIDQVTLGTSLLCAACEHQRWNGRKWVARNPNMVRKLLQASSCCVVLFFLPRNPTRSFPMTGHLSTRGFDTHLGPWCKSF